MSRVAALVVDSSALLDYLARQRRAQQIARLITVEVALHAPECIDLEMLSVLRRWELAGLVDASKAVALRGLFDQLPVVRHPLQPHNDRVWSLRQRITVSDAYYVSLAEALRAPLLTTDGRLARTVDSLAGVDVVPLGD